MSDRFVYRGGQRKVESVVKRSKQAGGLYDSWINPEFAFLKVKEGEMEVRIMPQAETVDMEKWGDGWEIAVYLHNNIGPDSGTYLCLEKMLGKPCPVCELRASGRLEDDEADKLKPAWRAVCWAVDKDSMKSGPQVWALPITLFREINNRSVDKRSNTPILIDDPDNGYNVIFDRQGTGLKTKYSGVEISRDPTLLHKDEVVQERWLKYINDNPLPTVLQYYDYEHIKKVVEGRIARKRGDDEDDAPRSTRHRARGDQEEEEAPRSRRRLAREDDEDEAPRSRRAREPEERPSRRAREEEEAPPPRRRREEDPEEDTRSARSSRRGEEEEDPPSSRRGSERRREAEPEEEAPSRRASSNGDAEEETRPVTRRRLAEPEPGEKTKEKGEKEDAGEGEDLPAAASTARRRISELKSRRAAD